MLTERPVPSRQVFFHAHTREGGQEQGCDQKSARVNATPTHRKTTSTLTRRCNPCGSHQKQKGAHDDMDQPRTHPTPHQTPHPQPGQLHLPDLRPLQLNRRRPRDRPPGQHPRRHLRRRPKPPSTLRALPPAKNTRGNQSRPPTPGSTRPAPHRTPPRPHLTGAA